MSSMKRYNPSEIEPKWQAAWLKEQISHAVDSSDKPKFVMLTEFPYPSGDGLHMGHMREYALGDIIARQRRMTGYNVLYPMGFDAFGLPTENYAIKNKIAPQAATERNVARFREQLTRMGFSIDWDRSFSTTDPEYYRWTQWLFLQFFKKGLAYQDEIAINWCPFCKTGLANEEVVNGRHERCENLVEKKQLKQWVLRITDYAERLIDGLKDVDYPSRIADQQINWIGRSTGAEVDFKIDSVSDTLTVFTTRPDTLFGATFMVLAPEHPLVAKITTPKQKEAVDTYIKAAGAKSDIERQNTDREKTGVPTGACAINPANNEKIPIWVADYVLMGYGTGAIMAVPAHDERDYAFATKFGIPIKQVVAPSDTDAQNPPREGKKDTKRDTVNCLVKHPTDDTYLTLKWPKRGWHLLVKGGIENGEDFEMAARREIREETGYHNLKFLGVMPITINSKFYAEHKDVNRDILTTTVSFQLENLDQLPLKRDEIEQAEDLKMVWTPRGELKNLGPIDGLGYMLDWLDGRTICFAGEGVAINSGEFDGLSTAEAKEKIVKWLSKKGVAREKINYKLRNWIFSRQRYWGEPIPIIHCRKDGAVPVPDDQLPVELPPVEHYEPTDDAKSPLSRIREWVETICPKCGGPAERETDTMPNWAGSNWYYLRYMDAHNNAKFADADKLKYWSPVDLYLGGMEHTTLHLLYSRFHHQFLYDQGLVPTPEPYAARRGQGIILAADGRKMSKSYGNVVDPSKVIDSGYGADAARLAVTFLAPYDQTTPWSPEGAAGCYRFLGRVWNLAQSVSEENNSGQADQLVKKIINRTIKKVTTDLEKMNFNTAIAALMEALNDLSKVNVDHDTIGNFVKLLAPFAPHIAEEIWRESLGEKQSIHLADWPTWDEKYLTDDQMTIAIQVNGKLRGEIIVATDETRENIEKLALKQENVAKFLGDKKPARIIYVPGKIVNAVVR